jgi:drug/metabolite transporter (DMT)-like permease
VTGFSPALPSGEPDPASPPPMQRVERPMFAIGLRLMAMIGLAVMFSAVKIADGRGVHIVESLFYRQLFACPVVLAWSAWTTGFGALKTRRIGVHISRTIIGMCGMVLNFGAYILLPLAEATAIGFMVPIIGTMLSALLLREKTGIHRWGAVVAGFVGVLVIVQPGHVTELPRLGLAVGLGAAAVTAIVSLLLRALGRTEGASTTVFYFTALSLPPLGILMLHFGRGHDPGTWALLVLIGVSGGIAQLLMTGALKFAPVSVVLPMDYSSLIWTTLIGWELWRAWPGTSTWFGAGLIVASGLYIAWRERVRAKDV